MKAPEMLKADANPWTPGPWRTVPVELGGEDTYFEVVAGKRTIVQTHARENRTEQRLLEEDRRNCRLIAAAPDLVEALTEWLHLFDRGGLALTNGVVHCVEITRAARARARAGAVS